MGLIVTQTLAVAKCESLVAAMPYLYNLVSAVSNAPLWRTCIQTPFGRAQVRIDATNGVFINGQHVVDSGMCNHQDHAGAGLALRTGLQYFRIERLKQMASMLAHLAQRADAGTVGGLRPFGRCWVLDEPGGLVYDSETLGSSNA